MPGQCKLRVNAEGTAIHAFRVVYAVDGLAPHLYVPVGCLILLIFSDNNAPICGLETKLIPRRLLPLFSIPRNDEAALGARKTE